MEEYQQLDLFAASYEDYKITKPIALIECFGGIGAQHKALSIIEEYMGKKPGELFHSHRLVEWAYKSILAYNAIHVKDWTDYSEGLTKEELIERVRGISANYNEPMTDAQIARLGEPMIRKIYSAMQATHDYCPDISRLKAEDLGINEKDKYTYMLCYSFPCQDLSLAGLGKSYERGSGTRSGLLWQVERLLLESKALGDEHMPDILIMENVPQVCGTKNLHLWGDWLNSLHKLGYTNYFKIINAKDCAIPQNRQRCFMVSILGEKSFSFPNKIKLRYHLKDFLDPFVDEKYYLSDELVASFERHAEEQAEKGNGFGFDPFTQEEAEEEEGHAILTRAGTRPCDNFIEDDIQNLGNYGSGHHAKDVSGIGGGHAYCDDGQSRIGSDDSREQAGGS